MTKPPAPLGTCVPAPRPGRRTPARPTTVVPLKGDLEARPRGQLKTELVALLGRDTTLVLDLHGATFLGAGAARLLLDLHNQAAAGAGRLVLWRPRGQPFRILRIARLERILDLRPASWRPPPSMDPTAPQRERRVDLRGDRPSALRRARPRAAPPVGTRPYPSSSPTPAGSGSENAEKSPTTTR